MKTDNTMPITGCIPNQLQALHDECGALRAENERLRALLRRAIMVLPCCREDCRCTSAVLYADINSVKELEAACPPT